MRRWTWLAVLGAIVLLLVVVRRAGRETEPPAALVPTPSASVRAPASSPQPEPSVPLVVATAEPELDRKLAQDLRKALEGQGLKVTAVAITDRRGAGGARRADIVYQTTTRGDVTALRPEISRIFGAGTSSRLALDLITVRATRPDGKIVATVSAGIPDIERWLRKQSSDDEFYRSWTMGTPSR